MWAFEGRRIKGGNRHRRPRPHPCPQPQPQPQLRPRYSCDQLKTKAEAAAIRGGLLRYPSDQIAFHAFLAITPDLLDLRDLKINFLSSLGEPLGAGSGGGGGGVGGGGEAQPSKLYVPMVIRLVNLPQGPGTKNFTR